MRTNRALAALDSHRPHWAGCSVSAVRGLQPLAPSRFWGKCCPGNLTRVSSERDWRQYEQQIFERLKAMAGEDAEVTFDVKLPGRFSGVDRQIDVKVEAVMPPIGNVTMGVDCKCFATKVDVKHVEMVMGLFEDVGIDIGLLVTTEGFTQAAMTRVKSARGMRLDIVPYKDLAGWEPDLVWCHICTDPESDDFPGGVYLEPLDPRNLPRGGDLARAVRRCERCQAIHVRCACGTTNAAYDAEEGEWIECEGGCSTEWRFGVELDRDALPLTEDPQEQVEFRRVPDASP